LASQIIERIQPTFRTMIQFLDERVLRNPDFREDCRANPFNRQAFQSLIALGNISRNISGCCKVVVVIEASLTKMPL